MACDQQKLTNPSRPEPILTNDFSRMAKEESITNSEQDLLETPQPHPTKQRQSPVLASHTSRLSDTAEVVREVAKKIGKTRIKWENPRSVMIITKPGDPSLVRMTRELALWFIETPRYGQPSGITVYVDEKIKRSRNFGYKKMLQRHPMCEHKLRFWIPELVAAEPNVFDFIVTLGGDGTVLFASWLFQGYTPPVIPFQMGSLGFLTPFGFENYARHLTNAMENGVRINLRGRLTCTVYRRVLNPDSKRSVKLRNIKRDPLTGKITVGDWCTSPKEKKHLKKFGEVDGEDYDEVDEFAGVRRRTTEEEEDDGGLTDYRQIPFFTTVPVERYHVINDLVVDRGPSPYMSLLELFGDDKHLTTVQADGLAISSPTGSTAYSLSAGGSLTHPEIRALLITPICPHTLSFRPTLVPDSMELRICVPYNSRNTAWASFDGRGRVELKQGDHIKVTASKYPFPTVCKEDQATDWFNSLSKCLHWNKRERQKSFAVVESHRGKNTQSSAPTTPVRASLSRPPSSTQLSRMGNQRKPSSEIGHEEVFAMIIDDDDRCRVNNALNLLEEEESIEESEEDDEDDDEDDHQEYEDGFTGWTDEEILKARCNNAKDLERLSHHCV
ncbi:hypothetical protein DFQ28_001126 [Apophysomyces sp. BC1034]|nr:hypothetical protein DFQ30_001270 [Apophysomyces sp. BC1015]KAG0180527.1 hypothetical protein DFQ29_000526 [Apophysomyces sp. BC1021]KAG0191002.1 hypothetical protein DFQ28_001126 [Apophysomyces sp. BC1034]